MVRHRCHDFIDQYVIEADRVHKVSFLRFMKWMADISVQPTIWMSHSDTRKAASQNDFGDEFTRQSIDYRHGRDLNQVEFLCYAFGVNYMDGLDYIIRMEDIENEFNQLPFVREHTTIPHDKKGSKDGPWWKTVIQKESEELIYQWAKDDFIAFNYERGEF
jgi:hypothetical protein